PADLYTVSFVFMHSGTPFAKKGGSEISLPSMDVPISVLEWEVFLPDQYKVKHFGGDAIAENLLAVGGGVYDKWLSSDVRYLEPPPAPVNSPEAKPLLPGQVGGVVVDPQGAVVAGATVKVMQAERGITRITMSDSSGNWVVSGIPAGRVKVEASAQGFNSTVVNLSHNGVNSSRADLHLSVGGTTETIEVTADAPVIETTQSQVSSTFSNERREFSGGSGGRDKK